MSPTTEHLFQAARSLPEAEQVELIDALIAALAARAIGATEDLGLPSGAESFEYQTWGEGVTPLEIPRDHYYHQLWADEFGGAGIRVNAVAPGPIETEGTADIPEIVEGLGRTRALERVGEPDEIARAVAFIAPPAASYINGVVLPVDGGAKALRPAA